MIPISQIETNKGQIKGLPKNPRLIRDEHFKKLLQSIKDNPEMLYLRELLVYPHQGKYVVIGGNMRLMAMKDLGYTEAPCKVIPEDTTVEQLKAYTIKDNAAYGEWDYDLLANEWDEVELDDWCIDIPDTKAVNPTAEAHEDDFDPDKPVETVCKKGDIWQLGNHRLMCGDSTDAGDVALLMDGEKADMCFTDPPYGVSIGTKNKLLKEKVAGGVGNAITKDIENDTASADELHDILVKCMTNVRENCKDDASYFVTAPLCMMMMMMHAGLKVRHVLMWLKNAPTFSLGRLDYDYQHEPIFYTWTKTHHNYRAGKFRTSVWTFDKPRKCDLHPTMKPVGLVSNCMLDTTKEGDNIIDLFGGSGTTLIAAEQLNRKCYMMELDPHYCDVIIARWEQFTGQKAKLLTNTKTAEP